MNKEEAIKILKDFNDGYTFQECTTCFKFNEKDSCCNKEKCEELEAIETVLNYIEELEKEREYLKKYISIAPNLDETTAVAYRNIQKDAYIRGRAEEQQKAEEIIHNHYMPKQVILDKIEELTEGIKSDLINREKVKDDSWKIAIDRSRYQKVETRKVLQEILKGEGE